MRWEQDIADVTGNTVNSPTIADADRVSDLYGMIHPNANGTQTVRSVFAIGPGNKVKRSRIRRARVAASTRSSA